MAVVAQLRNEQVLFGIDPDAVYAAQTGFLAAKTADQLAVFAEDRYGTSTSLFRNVDHAFGTAVNVAGGTDVVPLVKKLPFPVEELNAMVCPVTDQYPALRVDADLVYERELAWLRARRSP